MKFRVSSVLTLCKKVNNPGKRALLPFCFVLIISVFLMNMSVAGAQEKYSVSGITEPLEDVTLGLEVEGIISRVFCDEGDHVKKGKCLLELNNKLEELEINRRKLLWESKAEVDSALERVKTLKSILDSSRQLFEETKSISKEELDKQELEYKLAVAERKRLEIVEEREKIEYEMAIESLNKRRLRSPINGIVVKLLVDEGESCEEHKPLVQLVNTGKCLFVCNVEERTGRNLKKKQILELEIKTGDTVVSKKGKIIFISPVVDPASSLMEVKTEFDNRDGAVWPGMSGTMIVDFP